LKLKNKMKAKLIELETAVQQLKIASRPQGLDNAGGRLSRMNYIYNKATFESQMEKTKIEVNSLNRWLTIYDSPKFGKCSRFGIEININRLLLIPSSSRYIELANL